MKGRVDKEIPSLALFAEIRRDEKDLSDEVIAQLVVAQAIGEATSNLETISDSLQELAR